MNFERGTNPKETMGIGLSIYRICRMEVWEPGDAKKEMGFYIIGENDTINILQGLSTGKLRYKGRYLIEFFPEENLDGLALAVSWNKSILIKDLPTCIIDYYGKRFTIKAKNEF